MAFSEPWPNASLQAFARKKGIEEKRMFSGIGFLLSASDWNPMSRNSTSPER